MKDGGFISYYPNFLSQPQADTLYHELEYTTQTNNIPWAQKTLNLPHKQHAGKEARFTAFVGEREGLVYNYSNFRNVATKWTPRLDEARQLVEDVVGHGFNVALLNCYLDGSQHVNWHQDAEEDLVNGSSIVSLSLGASRVFQLRHISENQNVEKQHEAFRQKKQGQILTPESKKYLQWQVGTDPTLNKSFTLSHGDLFIMSGTLQQFWKHRVPPQQSSLGPRISITFRNVIDDALSKT